MAYTGSKKILFSLLFIFAAAFAFLTVDVYAEDFTMDFSVTAGGNVKAIINSTDTRECPDGSQLIVQTPTIQLEVTPSAGFSISSVKYVLSTGNERAMTATPTTNGMRYTLSNTSGGGDGTFIAVFTQRHTVSVSPSIDRTKGDITIAGATNNRIEVNDGGTVTYTVTPIDGYKIETVNGNAVSVTPGNNFTETLTINQDMVLTATFVERTYSVQFDLASGQSYVGEMEVTYNGTTYDAPTTIMMTYGSTATLRTYSTDILYEFMNYSNTGNGSINSPMTENAVFTCGASDDEVEAAFSKEYIQTNFNIGRNGYITYQGASGNVIVRSGTSEHYISAVDYRFSATPNSSLYQVGSVYYVSSDTGTTYDITPNGGFYTISKSFGDGTLYVNYTPIQSFVLTVNAPTEKNCYLTVKADGVKLAAGRNTVSSGATIVITASTDTGSGFLYNHIYVDGHAVTSSYKYTIDYLTGDTAVGAVFDPIDTFKITISASKGGTVSQSGGFMATATSVQVNKGDYLTFYVSPDAYYKVNSVKYSGANFSGSGNTYSVGPVRENGTLTVEFVSRTDGIVSEEIDRNGTTVVTLKSVDAVPDVVGNYLGCILKAPMPANGVVPKNVLSAIRGKNSTLRLTGGDYYWTIYAQRVSTNNLNANLLVTTGDNVISQRIMSPFAKFESKKQFSIAYDGLLPFNCDLSVNVGTENTGRYANLFRLNESTYKLELINCVNVDKLGYATYSFSHASDYVIVVADKKLTSGDLASAEGVSFEEQTNGMSFKNFTPLKTAGILLGIVIVVGAVIAIVFSRSDKSKNK